MKRSRQKLQLRDLTNNINNGSTATSSENSDRNGIENSSCYDGHNQNSRGSKRGNDEPPIKKATAILNKQLVDELNINSMLTRSPLLPLKTIFYHPKSEHIKFINYIENKSYKFNHLFHQITTIEPKKFSASDPKIIEQINTVEWLNIMEYIESIDELKERDKIDLNELFFIDEISFNISNNYENDNFDDLIEHSQFFLYETKSHFRKAEKSIASYYFGRNLWEQFGLNRNTCEYDIVENHISREFYDSTYYLFMMIVSRTNPKVNSSMLIQLNIDKQNELHKSILRLVQQNSIHLNIKSIEKSKINFELYLSNKLKIVNVNENVSFTTRNNYNMDLQYLMTYYFFSKQTENINFRPQNHDNSNCNDKDLNFDHEMSKECNENLFDMVHELHGNNKSNEISDEEYDKIKEISNLKPMLRPYQVKAIKWMLRRECYFEMNQNETSNDENGDADLHVLYNKVVNKLNQTIYFHKYFGLYSFEKPLQIKSERGGILADEMGLGKTLEILALISINQCKNDDFKKFDIQSILSNKKLCDSIKKPKTNKPTFTCICRNTPNSFRNYAEKSSSPTKAFKRNNKSKPKSGKVKKSKMELFDYSHLFGYIDHDDDDDDDREDDEFDDELIIIDYKNDPLVYQCRLCYVYMHVNCVNYKDTREKFLCMSCSSKIEPISSKTTLVVTPALISHQWADEIKKHAAKNLNVLIYTGTSSGFIQPRDLAKFDIVVTTYDVLAEELSHIFAIENKRQLRNVSRYANKPSPINCVKWWRIVLDEAQMVHSTNSKCAEMANRLSAFNRWCVTGTPVGRSLSDLYGLFVFIREDPYLEKKWFNELLYVPFVNQSDRMSMARAVSQVLWRSSKRNVADQIDIPNQTEKVYWLEFSPFEQHLYERVLDVFREHRKSLFKQHGSNNRDRELQQISDLFETIDSRLRLDELDRNKLTHLLSPILDLRLTCNHPQLILRKRSFMGQSRNDQTKLLSMEKSIEMLEKKTQGECDNIYRILIMHRNALAGIHIIKQEYEIAIQIYQNVLNSESKEYDHHVKLDLLQKIHATYNLIDLLKVHHSQTDRMELEKNLSDYEKKYSSGFSDSKMRQERRLKEKIDIIDEYVKENFSQTKTCWHKMLFQIKSFSKEEKLDEFWRKFNYEFGSTIQPTEILDLDEDQFLVQKSFKLYGIEVNSFDQIWEIIHQQIDRLFKSRDYVLDKLRKLYDNLESDVVHKSAQCHLRNKIVSSSISSKTSRLNTNSLNSADKCHLCVADDAFENYVKNLFSNNNNVISTFQTDSLNKDESQDNIFYDENNNEDEFEDRRYQSSNRSDLEKFLKMLYLFYRTIGDSTNEKFIEVGKKFLDIINGLKEEFKLMRKFWTQTSYYVNALDELEICKMRMKLRNSKDQIYLYEEDNLLIKENELEAQFFQHNNSSHNVENELKHKLGQLHYLKNLKKSISLEEGKENEEPCSICLQNIGYSWYVLACGHSFCVECFNDLVKNDPLANQNKLKCPLCRVVNSKTDAFLVTTRKQIEKEQNSTVNQVKSNNKNDDKTIFKNNFVDDLSKIKIRGSCNSAKVEGVVKCLLNITCKDKSAKCLVFSEHSTILELIIDLIKDNNIRFKYIKDSNSLQKKIQQFKEYPEINVLLMPYSFGANGLNIIEATHVLLVEPTLNKSQEIQAIGRIHRIGQTKPTFVHRFLIRDSIEELVFRLFKNNTSYSSRIDNDPIDSTKPNCSKQFENQKQLSEIVEEKRLTIADIKDLYLKL